MSNCHVLGSASALLVLFVLLLSSAPAVHAQGVGQGALGKAFEAGNARAVLQQAAGRVEVGVLGSSSQYSRSQAVYVIGKFFESHPPRRFSWQSTSTSGRSRFLTGRYWHEGVKQPLRVYVRLSKAEKKWQLQEVRIERP